MALDFETILAGARASHRVAQIEEQRRELLQRHDAERSAQDSQGEDLARQLQELEVQRARLESLTVAHGQAQQALNQRHEEERDASTAQVQDANQEYIQVVQSAVRDSEHTPEKLAEIFDRQREILISAGMLPDAVEAPTEPSRDTARPRTSERGYRRGRRGSTESPQTSEPALAAPPEPAASDDEAPAPEPEILAPEAAAPAPVGPTETDLAPSSRDESAIQPPRTALPTIAEEGARIDAEVEALAQTPARVTLTDPAPASTPLSENDWFGDVRRVIPPTAVSAAAPAIAAPVLTAPQAAGEAGSDAPEAAPPSAAVVADDGDAIDAPVPVSAPDTIASAPAPVAEVSGPAPVPGEAAPSFDLPGTPAIPDGSPEIDGFDELERQFGGRDLDFDVPDELR